MDVLGVRSPTNQVPTGFELMENPELGLELRAQSSELEITGLTKITMAPLGSCGLLWAMSRGEP